MVLCIEINNSTLLMRVPVLHQEKDMAFCLTTLYNHCQYQYILDHSLRMVCCVFHFHTLSNPLVSIPQVQSHTQGRAYVIVLRPTYAGRLPDDLSHATRIDMGKSSANHQQTKELKNFYSFKSAGNHPMYASLNNLSIVCKLQCCAAVTWLKI